MSTAVERIVGEVMDGLLTCLCAKLADTQGGTPCFCGMVGGQQAIADFCSCNGENKCGQAWVRLDRIYPYDQSVTTQARSASCTSPLAAVIEVGVYRCIPTSDGAGNAPDVAAQTNQALTAAADAGAMVSAMACCDALRSRTHVLGTYLPKDSGDCGGGLWPVTVALQMRPPRGA